MGSRSVGGKLARLAEVFRAPRPDEGATSEALHEAGRRMGVVEARIKLLEKRVEVIRHK